MEGVKKLLIVLFLVPLLVAAQSIGVVYDFKSKTTTPVTMVAEQRLVNNLFGQEWLDIDGLALVGATTGRNRATTGAAALAIAWQPMIAQNLRLQLGVVGHINAGAPVATGVLFGLAFRF